MTSPHRLIAADSSPRTLHVVRAALDLLERPAVVIEAPSGEAALAELGRGGVNLLVSAFALPDMRGFELALKAKKTAPDTPVVILAGAGDPVVDEETRANSPFHYIVRAEKGEQFVRILRALLDGEEIEEAAPLPQEAADALGPVPPVSVKRLNEVLGSILTDVGAMAVVLADREGTLLLELGAVGYLDRERLTRTLAPIFARMANVGPMVGGAKPRAMHFYDGDEFDIFALSVGFHHFACLIFEGSAGTRAFGSVTMYGRRAVDQMVEIIGEAAYRVPSVEEAKPARAAEAHKESRREERKPAAAPTPTAAAPTPEEYVPSRPPKLEPLPEDLDLEKVLSGLDKLDLSKADELFDPDKLAEMAAQALAGERLSFEEAQQLGVMQK